MKTVKEHHERNFNILKKYIPEPAAALFTQWIFEYKVKLTITRRRETKLGDYTYRGPDRGHHITINHDLSPFEFLITLAHEFAHLRTYVKYQNKVLPHGLEWKKEYQECLLPFIRMNIFPPDLLHALHRHLHRPPASSCADQFLQKVLSFYDVPEKKDGQILLEYLPAHALFEYRKKVYRKEQKLRKRIICECQQTRQRYLFQPVVRVNPIL